MRVISAFILFFLILLLSNDVESKASVQQVRGMIAKSREKCQKKSGATSDAIDATHSGVFSTDPALQCYYKCILQMLNVVKNDKFSVNSLVKQINAVVSEDVSGKMVEMAHTCSTEALKFDDLCMMSWQFTKCWYEIDSSLYLFP